MLEDRNDVPWRSSGETFINTIKKNIIVISQKRKIIELLGVDPKSQSHDSHISDVIKTTQIQGIYIT